MELTKEEVYDVVIYIHRSTQILDRECRVDEQRLEIGHVVVVTTRASKKEKLKVIEIRKGSCGGRAGNFDSEVRAIKEAVIWIGRNRVERALIRSDSTAAITTVKDMRAGPGQEEAEEIRKRMRKIERRIDIEWVKGHNGDERNERADKEAKKARTRSQKTITIIYLMAMISSRATRNNSPGIPSRYYMFDYARPQKSTLDEEERAIAVTISRLQGNCAITGSFLHRIKKAKSGRCWRYQGARDTVTHSVVKCRVWEQERKECFRRRPVEEHTRERSGIIQILARGGDMSREEQAHLLKRKGVIEEALKRWLKRKVRGIGDISIRERLCEEVWRPAIARYIRKTGAGMQGPSREVREEWEVQIDNQ